jgi:arylsulfatase A-like enzyme
MSGRISSSVTAFKDNAEGSVLMDTPPRKAAGQPLPTKIRLTASAAVLLAISFGLCGGYLDLFLMLFRDVWWDEEWILRWGRDFPWTVPAAHAVLLLIPAILIAALSRLRPRLVSLRAGSWLFATLAIWAALLRLPLYGAATLLLAAGLGRPISAAVATRDWSRRTVRYAVAGLFGLLAVLAALSSGLQAIEERRAVAQLPPSPPGARNVVLIVWDTVRAYNLSAYGYSRNTTPNLARWARKGVQYQLAAAPAPWTYPSHSCFFTGQWPYRLNSQWKYTLDSPDPTLAEYLASRGYQTAGFAANTNCCNYETGLARGFAHFEDFPLTLRSFLGRTVPGRWILTYIVYQGQYHVMKWISLQSRGAWGTNDAFLDWLRERRPDRPFFAFLNYFDAHAPYVPPPGFRGRFGIRPSTPQDYRFLLGSMNAKVKRNVQMALDCYDDCIAFLDDQLGRLLHELQGQGLLDNTVVIITSDHGEGFGDHGRYGHAYSLFRDVTGVPLVILSPEAPAGRVVDSPVSLRDLPATVIDQLGLSAGSPFPGRSLAVYWRSEPGQMPRETTTPAFSEMADANTFQPQLPSGHDDSELQMSLVASGHHYLRDGMGAEILYDLIKDPFERVNLMGSSYGDQAVGSFRRMLLDVLTKNPGSREAEQAYLGTFRQELKDLVQKNSTRRVASGPFGVTTSSSRRRDDTRGRPTQ